MNFFINGNKYTTQEGTTVLVAARTNGVYIPSLCYHRKTGPAARCRACVVEIAGMRGLQTACNMQVREGMNITTDSERVLGAQRMVIDLLLSSGHHDCQRCDKNGACELQYAAEFLGVEQASMSLDDEFEVDGSGEFIYRDPGKCILCGRCVAGCNQTVVNEVLDLGRRGSETRVICDNDLPMGTSSCVQCGECVQLCPTGALVDRKAHGKWGALEAVDTTCAYCGVGCQITLHTDKAANRIVRVTGREVPPNDGMLCVKGRYAYDFPSSDKRLKYPMIKKDGIQVPVSWDEALDYTAARIKEIIARDGPDVFSAFGSGRITNENNYAIQKFTRAVIGTNNVDHCARACHAPTVAGLAAAFGSGAMTNSISEIEDAKVIFVIGANVTEAHPVISYYMKRAVKRGAIMIVNDPRMIDLTRWATLHVQLRVGTDVAYINGLINEIFKNGWAREEFLRLHTENHYAIREGVKDYTVEEASDICGVPVEQMKQVAQILGEAESVSVCYTLGITEHICGTDNVKTLANLQMVLGNIGKYAAGINPMRGQNNVQGACDMGALPNVFHNYQPVDNKDVSERIAKAWGVAQLPQRPGYRTPTMLHKALSGGTKILYCVGDNTVHTEPHMANTIKEIEALEFFVVCDIFPNITTPYADVIFPDTSWGEEDGTFSNTERRVSRVRRALTPPGAARSHWWVMQELAKRFGQDLGFTSAESVWEDMRKSSPSYAGITWERIDKIGLQWPCPTLQHPGTPFLHRDGKFTRGKGLFTKTGWIPQAEPPDEEYPFILSTGRRLWHYHSRTQTGNSVGFDHIFPEELLEINPADARRLGINDGDTVQATSRRGAITLKAWVTERSAPGVAWCSFHFAEACANVLTIDRYDHVTETAEYKACAIQIVKISDGTAALGTGTPRQARP